MRRTGDRVGISGAALMRYRGPNGQAWEINIPNGVTVGGVNWFLETAFRGGPQSSTIYVGLIDDNGFIEVANSTDTYDSHPGWAEYAALDSLARPSWLMLPANGGTLGASFPSQFTFTAAGSIRGMFLSTIGTVGGAGPGVLYNTAIALVGYPVDAGGTLDVYPNVRLRRG